MELFYIANADEAKCLLRAPLRSDLLRNTATGSVTLYTDRQVARQKARLRRALARKRANKPRSDKRLSFFQRRQAELDCADMFLVRIEITGVLESWLESEAIDDISKKPIVSWHPKRSKAYLARAAVQALSNSAYKDDGSVRLSMEIVPGTASDALLEGKPAPECCVGFGPYGK